MIGVTFQIRDTYIPISLYTNIFIYLSLSFYIYVYIYVSDRLGILTAGECFFIEFYVMAAEASVLAAQVASREAIFREMLEEDILRNMEVVQAAGGTDRGVLSSYTELKNWAALEATLRVLAFDTDEDAHPWLALGIATLEGPQPTVEGIDQRANLANLLSSGCSTTAWKEEDRQKTADWIRRTEKMREECQADPPRISRERRRKKTDTPIPRWTEPSPELLKKMIDVCRSIHHRLKWHCTFLTSRRWISICTQGPWG